MNSRERLIEILTKAKVYEAYQYETEQTEELADSILSAGFIHKWEVWLPKYCELNWTGSLPTIKLKDEVSHDRPRD